MESGVRTADLTTKARIRRAALELFAEHGDNAVSMRMVGRAAGVAVGLVQHHFKTKEGLRDAVDEWVVRSLVEVATSAGADGTVESVFAAREAAVRELFVAQPAIPGYVRRSLLAPDSNQHVRTVIAMIGAATWTELEKLEAAGTAPAGRRSVVVAEAIMRGVAAILLEPVFESVWELTAAPGESEPVPRMVLTLTDPAPGSD